jgi:hypothetical protein
MGLVGCVASASLMIIPTPPRAWARYKAAWRSLGRFFSA